MSKIVRNPDGYEIEQTMSRLKRCPFCGDEVEIFRTSLYHWKYAIHHKTKSECVLDTQSFLLPYEKDVAIEMWNRRADDERGFNQEV